MNIDLIVQQVSAQPQSEASVPSTDNTPAPSKQFAQAMDRITEHRNRNGDSEPVNNYLGMQDTPEDHVEIQGETELNPTLAELEQNIPGAIFLPEHSFKAGAAESLALLAGKNSEQKLAANPVKINTLSVTSADDAATDLSATKAAVAPREHMAVPREHLAVAREHLATIPGLHPEPRVTGVSRDVKTFAIAGLKTTNSTAQRFSQQSSTQLPPPIVTLFESNFIELGQGESSTSSFNNGLQLGSGANVINPGMPNQSSSDNAMSNIWLRTPVSSPEWGQQFSRQLSNLIEIGNQRVTLHLNPRELGPLTVDIKISDQQAQLQFVSLNPLVRSALENAMPQLRDFLAEQNISLGETTVDDHRNDAQQDSTDSQRRGLLTNVESENLPDPTEGSPELVNLAPEGQVDLYV